MKQLGIGMCERNEISRNDIIMTERKKRSVLYMNAFDNKPLKYIYNILRNEREIVEISASFESKLILHTHSGLSFFMKQKEDQTNMILQWAGFIYYVTGSMFIQISDWIILPFTIPTSKLGDGAVEDYTMNCMCSHYIYKICLVKYKKTGAVYGVGSDCIFKYNDCGDFSVDMRCYCGNKIIRNIQHDNEYYCKIPCAKKGKKRSDIRNIKLLETEERGSRTTLDGEYTDILCHIFRQYKQGSVLLDTIPFIKEHCIYRDVQYKKEERRRKGIYDKMKYIEINIDPFFINKAVKYGCEMSLNGVWYVSIDNTNLDKIDKIQDIHRNREYLYLNVSHNEVYYMNTMGIYLNKSVGGWYCNKLNVRMIEKYG